MRGGESERDSNAHDSVCYVASSRVLHVSVRKAGTTTGRSSSEIGGDDGLLGESAMKGDLWMPCAAYALVGRTRKTVRRY